MPSTNRSHFDLERQNLRLLPFSNRLKLEEVLFFYGGDDDDDGDGGDGTDGDAMNQENRRRNHSQYDFQI